MPEYGNRSSDSMRSSSWQCCCMVLTASMHAVDRNVCFCSQHCWHAAAYACLAFLLLQLLVFLILVGFGLVTGLTSLSCKTATGPTFENPSHSILQASTASPARSCLTVCT
jgi:hypothetical protein